MYQGINSYKLDGGMMKVTYRHMARLIRIKGLYSGRSQTGIEIEPPIVHFDDEPDQWKRG